MSWTSSTVILDIQMGDVPENWPHRRRVEGTGVQRRRAPRSSSSTMSTASSPGRTSPTRRRSPARCSGRRWSIPSATSGCSAPGPSSSRETSRPGRPHARRPRAGRASTTPSSSARRRSHRRRRCRPLGNEPLPLQGTAHTHEQHQASSYVHRYLLESSLDRARDGARGPVGRVIDGGERESM